MSTRQQNGQEGKSLFTDVRRKHEGNERKQWQDIAIKDGIRTMMLLRQGSIRGTVKLEDGTPVSQVRIGVRYHDGCRHTGDSPKIASHLANTSFVCRALIIASAMSIGT